LWFVWPVAWFSVEPFEPQNAWVRVRAKVRVRVRFGHSGGIHV